MRVWPSTAAVLITTLLCAAAFVTHACSAKPAPPTFRPCPEPAAGVECGTFTVLEDRNAVLGRTIAVNFLIERAATQPAHEAVFAFAGGPGDASTRMAGAWMRWLDPIKRSHDVVYMDQRGTGGSHPLECPIAAAADPASAFGHVINPAVVKQCRDNLSRDADLTKYTTDDAVRDVEELRIALGYDRISLYGVSYGTRLAQAYMRRFPTRVTSAVLDGVVPFDGLLPVGYATGSQQAIELIWNACSLNPSCHDAHRDPASDFAALLHRFDNGPIATFVTTSTGPVNVHMSRGDFAYAVRGILYNANASARLPDIVGHAVSTGDLSAFATSYWNRAVRLGAAIALGTHLSVLCAEDVPFVSDAEAAAASDRTFLGRYLLDEYRAACALWPRASIAADFRAPVAVTVPTLLVSGFFDPVTPPSFADLVARGLPQSATIVVPGAAHGSVGGCAREAAVKALGEGTLNKSGC